MKELASKIIVFLWLAVVYTGIYIDIKTYTYNGKYEIDVINNGVVTKSYFTNEYEKYENIYEFVDYTTAQKFELIGNNIKVKELK